jgi:hypothetical protein
MAILKTFLLPEDTNVASLMDDENIKVLITKTPYEVKNGYIRVGEIYGTKNTISFQVQYKSNREGEVLILENYTFTPSVAIGSKNFIKQAYVYMKTLPQFADGEDILEDE